jgi:hypothetical protein
MGLTILAYLVWIAKVEFKRRVFIFLLFLKMASWCGSSYDVWVLDFLCFIPHILNVDILR